MLGPWIKTNWKWSKGGRHKGAFGGKRSEEKEGVSSLQKCLMPTLLAHLCFLTMLSTSQFPCSVSRLDYEEHVKARLKSHSDELISKSFNQPHVTKYGSIPWKQGVWAGRRPVRKLNGIEICICHSFVNPAGLPRWCYGKEPACQSRRHKRCGFHPWVGKMPWRRKWQHTSILAWRIPIDRAVWRATVHRITKSQTLLRWLSAYSSSNNILSIIQAVYPQLGSEERDKVSCYANFWSGNPNNIHQEWNEDLSSNEWVHPPFFPSFICFLVQ